jgi:hypothetical protein
VEDQKAPGAEVAVPGAAAVSGRRIRHWGGSERALQYLKDRPGQRQSVSDISDGTGIPHSTVSGGLSRFIETGLPGLVKHKRGWFEYMPPSVAKAVRDSTLKVGDFLECVGFTPEGDPLVRDEMGIIHVLRFITKIT